MISCSWSLIFSRSDEQLVQLGLAEHRAQRGLRELAGGVEVVLHLHHRALRVDDAEVDHRVDLDRDVVAGDHVLRRHVEHHGAQGDPHHPVERPEDEARGPGPWAAPSRRPSRKTTPRSYSLSTLTQREAGRSPDDDRPIAEGDRSVHPRAPAWLHSGGAHAQQRQAVDRHHFDRLAGRDRLLGHRVPDLAVHEHLAARRERRARRRRARATSPSRPVRHRRALRAQHQVIEERPTTTRGDSATPTISVAGSPAAPARRS